jgi:hypothetical protein
MASFSSDSDSEMEPSTIADGDTSDKQIPSLLPYLTFKKAEIEV